MTCGVYLETRHDVSGHVWDVWKTGKKVGHNAGYFYVIKRKEQHAVARARAHWLVVRARGLNKLALAFGKWHFNSIYIYMPLVLPFIIRLQCVHFQRGIAIHTYTHNLQHTTHRLINLIQAQRNCVPTLYVLCEAKHKQVCECVRFGFTSNCRAYVEIIW